MKYVLSSCLIFFCLIVKAQTFFYDSTGIKVDDAKEQFIKNLSEDSNEDNSLISDEFKEEITNIIKKYFGVRSVLILNFKTQGEEIKLLTNTRKGITGGPSLGAYYTKDHFYEIVYDDTHDYEIQFSKAMRNLKVGTCICVVTPLSYNRYYISLVVGKGVVKR